jgi:hypothetical protein
LCVYLNKDRCGVQLSFTSDITARESSFEAGRDNANLATLETILEPGETPERVRATAGAPQDEHFAARVDALLEPLPALGCPDNACHTPRSQASPSMLGTLRLNMCAQFSSLLPRLFPLIYPRQPKRTPTGPVVRDASVVQAMRVEGAFASPIEVATAEDIVSAVPALVLGPPAYSQVRRFPLSAPPPLPMLHPQQQMPSALLTSVRGSL